MFPEWELLYADDTMLIGSRARELNILLKAIENECKKCNLKLNYGKCNYIAMNSSPNTHFRDGKKTGKSCKSNVLRRDNKSK